MKRRFQISDFRFQIGIAVFLVILDLFLQGYLRRAGWGVLNRGVSFGILPGLGQVAAVVIYFIFIILYLNSLRSRKFSWELSLLALGGLGNLIPRLLWGGVWDYLFLPMMPFWFNLSDVMITVGVVSYILRGNGNPNFVRR